MKAAATSRPYTVAVLADIHGNLAALRAVLADLARRSYDRMVIAGDLVRSGPRPAETVDVLWDLEAAVLYGNSDRAVADPEHDDPGARWVRRAIGPERTAWLAALPFDCRITPPGGVSPDDDLLVVHATPTDVAAVLTVEPDGQGLLCVTPEAQAHRLLGDARANLIVAGHVHYASSGTAAGRRFATVGSVGFPWDGDHRAAYALVAWDGRSWQLHHRRVAYDHLAVVEDLRRTGAPFAAEASQKLLSARLRPDLVP
jgi:predicted phosphodiesterase